MVEFWISNYEIHKRVIQEDIQCYLGPGATARSFTRNGEDGFLVSSPGECLTDEQIDDICRKSRDRWEKEAAARMQAQADSDKKLKRPAQQPVLMSSRGSNSRGSSLAPDNGQQRQYDEYQGEGSSRRSNDRRRVDRYTPR